MDPSLPRITPLRGAILGLLSQEPLSGYDIRKVFGTTPMGHFSESPGSIYPALARLEADGLIEGEVEGAHTMRPRRKWRLTDAGWALLTDWLAQEPTSEDVKWRIDELMLRFAFMEGVLGRKASLAFLQQLAALLRKALADLQAYAASTSFPMVTARLGLESGIEQYSGYVRWAERAIEAMRGGSTEQSEYEE